MFARSSCQVELGCADLLLLHRWFDMASKLTFDDPDKQRQYEQVDLELMRQEVRTYVIWTRVGLKVVGKQFVGRHKGKRKME